MTYHLVSWNVNGIRAAIKKGLFEFIKSENPDVICFQETKARPEQVEVDLPEYYQYWCSAEKKGYSGTAIFTKLKPLNVVYGLGIEEHDQEGRVITLEFEKAFLVTVYTPNAKRGLERLDYRSSSWDVDFLAYVKGLEVTKPVIFCGDLNVAHKEIDLANPKRNQKNAGFTIEERQGFDNIVAANFIDTFRHFNQDPENYSWWSYRSGAREKNIGWRIDYFLVSSTLIPALSDAKILSDVMGSDHCPVSLKIKKEALVDQQ